MSLSRLPLVHVERVVLENVDVVHPGGEYPKATQVTSIFMCDEIVRIVCYPSEIRELTDRLTNNPGTREHANFSIEHPWRGRYDALQIRSAHRDALAVCVLLKSIS